MKNTVWVLALWGSANLGGQTRVDAFRQIKNVDFSAANLTKPFRSGSSLPPTACTPGEAYFTQPPAADVYVCVGGNTWSKVVLAGAGSADGDLLSWDAASGRWQSSGVVRGHLTDTANPHHVSASQVGNTTAQWNANRLLGVGLSCAQAGAGWIWGYNAASQNWECQSPAVALGYQPLSGTGNLIELSNISTARYNLGLGDASLKGVSGTGSRVPTEFGAFAAGAVLVKDSIGNVVDSGCSVGSDGLACPGAGDIVVLQQAVKPTPPPAGSTLLWTDSDAKLHVEGPSGTDATLTTSDDLTDAKLGLSDVTTNNSTSSRHGFLPKLSGNPTDVLHGDGTFSPASGSAGASMATGGFWCFPSCDFANGGSVAPVTSAGFVAAFLWTPAVSGTVNKISVNVATAPGTGKSFAVGIYSTAGALLGQATSATNVSGIVTLTIAGGVPVVAGTPVYLALSSDSTVTAFRTLVGAYDFVGLMNAAGVKRVASGSNTATGAGTSLTLPATLGTLTALGGVATSAAPSLFLEK